MNMSESHLIFGLNSYSLEFAMRISKHVMIYFIVIFFKMKLFYLMNKELCSLTVSVQVLPVIFLQ